MLIVMTLLIAIELLVLGLATSSLTDVRAYVSGEGQWSKSQKDAVYHLQKYGQSHNQADYEAIHKRMKVILGDKKARIELEKKNPDYNIAYQGFLEGNNYPSDSNGLIKVYRRFSHIYYIDKAIGLWTDTDPYID